MNKEQEKTVRELFDLTVYGTLKWDVGTDKKRSFKTEWRGSKVTLVRVTYSHIYYDTIILTIYNNGDKRPTVYETSGPSMVITTIVSEEHKHMIKLHDEVYERNKPKELSMLTLETGLIDKLIEDTTNGSMKWTWNGYHYKSCTDQITILLRPNKGIFRRDKVISIFVYHKELENKESGIEDVDILSHNELWDKAVELKDAIAKTTGVKANYVD